MDLADILPVIFFQDADQSMEVDIRIEENFYIALLIGQKIPPGTQKFLKKTKKSQNIIHGTCLRISSGTLKKLLEKFSLEFLHRFLMVFFQVFLQRFHEKCRSDNHFCIVSCRIASIICAGLSSHEFPDISYKAFPKNIHEKNLEEFFDEI